MSTRVVRRHKRRRVEEMMAWLLLPAVLIVGYVVSIAVIDKAGGVAPEVLDFKAMPSATAGVQRSTR